MAMLSFLSSDSSTSSPSSLLVNTAPISLAKLKQTEENSSAPVLPHLCPYPCLPSGPVDGLSGLLAKVGSSTWPLIPTPFTDSRILLWQLSTLSCLLKYFYFLHYLNDDTGMLLFLLSGRKRKRKGGKERGEKGTEGRKKKERERKKKFYLLPTSPFIYWSFLYFSLQQNYLKKLNIFRGLSFFPPIILLNSFQSIKILPV